MAHARCHAARLVRRRRAVPPRGRTHHRDPSHRARRTRRRRVRRAGSRTPSLGARDARRLGHRHLRAIRRPLRPERAGHLLPRHAAGGARSAGARGVAAARPTRSSARTSPRATASLRVSDEARTLAHDILYPPVTATLRPVAAVMRQATVGLLPPNVRREYALGVVAPARASSRPPRLRCAHDPPGDARHRAPLAARPDRGTPLRERVPARAARTD